MADRGNVALARVRSGCFSSEIKLKREVGACAVHQTKAVRSASAGKDGAVGAWVLGGAGDVAVEVEVDRGDALDLRGVADQLLLHGKVGDLGAHGCGGIEVGLAAAVLEPGGKASGKASGRRDGKSSLVSCEQGVVGVVRRGSGEAGKGENGREMHLYLRD